MARSPLGPAVPGSLAGGASEPVCWAGPSLIPEEAVRPRAPHRAAGAGGPVGSRSALRAKDGRLRATHELDQAFWARFV